MAYIEGNHDFVARFISSQMPMVKYSKPEGTYLAWLDVSAVADKIGASALAERGEQEQRAVGSAHHARDDGGALSGQAREGAPEPGCVVRLGGAGHMRMNIATSRKLVELALTNMAGALRHA